MPKLHGITALRCRLMNTTKTCGADCRSRRYLLESPYQCIVNNTKADAYRTFGVPEANLSEHGMVYVV